ncbi:hypothetical protein [Sandarakinorhabdus rubra]|uniref:hypothetical protein n=1 Tax=Sandarakinorhabdus rubra TaxID=2672568 RepID=UPI0013D9CD24|nr:hypothetical protein [Sandarakinorhabdus rubra]
MKKALISSIVSVCALIAQPALAQQQTAVTFARGAISTTLKGSIKGNQYRDYIVNARAGQTMTVRLTNPDGRAYFNVMAPGSTGEAVFIGSTQGNNFSGPVPGTGANTVRVYQMRASGRRGATANYTISIGVTGRGAAVGGMRPSVDAKVPGTNYNATAEIPCITAAGMAKTRCKAGVMRMAMGEATVEIATADGGQRHIYFKNGRASSSDANAPMRVTRQGDVSIIRIGTVEVYEIVDAFVVGG